MMTKQRNPNKLAQERNPCNHRLSASCLGPTPAEGSELTFKILTVCVYNVSKLPL